MKVCACMQMIRYAVFFPKSTVVNHCIVGMYCVYVYDKVCVFTVHMLVLLVWCAYYCCTKCYLNGCAVCSNVFFIRLESNLVTMLYTEAARILKLVESKQGSAKNLTLSSSYKVCILLVYWYSLREL